MNGAPDSGESGRNEARILFDADFYRRTAALGAAEDAYDHYLRDGWRNGLKPNVMFEPDWYRARNPDAAGSDPLRHYAKVGEAADRDPSPLFDVAWYRRTYGAQHPLAHYLARRFGPFSPAPEFDAAFYLNAYPDVGASGLDPFQHYLLLGFREFRLPFAGFEPRLYALRRMQAARGMNPVAHMRAQGLGPVREIPRPGGAHAAARVFSKAGPGFEPPAPPLVEAPRALVLAFYLPQFHRIPENDAWWGPGHTEWTALARGQPRFEGHYQPRIPGELGFYDLTNPATLRAQAKMARGAGVGAFVFYAYDFGGRRLLQAPVDLFLATRDIDIGFCLMWANENWTRRWDGAEADVLIAQDYAPALEAARIDDFARHFRDPRYLRLEGRPALMVYRASLIPDTAATLARWRALFRERHDENPIFVLAQTFDDRDPRPLGFDAAIEFPPHKLTRGLPQVFDALDVFDEGLDADLYAYDDVVAASLSESPPDHPLIKTAVPSWDNDARRQGKGLTLVGATPDKFERWLCALIAQAPAFFGARVVAVNAWNEWSEGAYLEPDVHYGAACLNAVQRATFGRGRETLGLAVVGDPPSATLGSVARGLAAAFGLRIAPFARAQDVAGSGLQAALVQDVHDAAALRTAGVVVADESELAAAGDGRMTVGARALFARLFPNVAKVSAVLHIPQRTAPSALRLASLFAQTLPLWEIVVIDETGSEAALDVVDAAARNADRDVSFFLDPPAPGGRTPWTRILEATTGDFVWVMGPEGACEPTFAQRIATPMMADPRLSLGVCDSAVADPLGRRLFERPSPIAARARSPVDRVYEGEAAHQVTPSPLSATVWRGDAVRAALARLGGAPDHAALVREIAQAPNARIFHIADALDLIPQATAVDRNLRG